MEDELKHLKARIEKIEETLKHKPNDWAVIEVLAQLRRKVDELDRSLKALAEATAKGLELSNSSAAQAIRRDFKK